jgi:FixJ family two-component response regulator
VVVVLDDDKSVCRALVRLLQAAGHPARGFTCGEEFLKSWHSDPPDCLLLDLQMPGLSGVEVNQAGADFPVIVITAAHDGVGVREEAISRGAVAYLRKPVEASILVNAVMVATSRFTVHI